MTLSTSDFYQPFDEQDAYYGSSHSSGHSHWSNPRYSQYHEFYEEPRRSKRNGRRNSVRHTDMYYHEDENEAVMYEPMEPVYPLESVQLPRRHWSEKEEYRDDQDTEELPTEQEILAIENAKRNQYISSDAPPVEDDEQTLTEVPETQPVVMTSLPRKRCLAGMFFTLRRKLADAKRTSLRLTGTNEISIHTILAQPTGDILDEYQRREIVEKLQSPSNVVSSAAPTKDATKVAKLDQIWVFGQEEGKASNVDVAVWTGFDFSNQMLIKKYAEQCQHRNMIDEGIELFDSHIRHGELPILVLPTRGLLYYPITKESGFAALQVRRITNSRDVQFVYRAL